MLSRFGLLVRMRRTGTALVVAVLVGVALPGPVLGAINISAATGGTAISADTNSVDGSGAYTTLGAARVIGTLGTLRAGIVMYSLSDPSKFEFLIESMVPTFTGSGCGSLGYAGAVYGGPIKFLHFRLNGTSTGTCSVSVAGIKVRPTTAGAAGFAKGRVVVSCDTCGIPTARGIGELAVVPGAPRLRFTQGPIQDARFGGDLEPQPTVKSADQFGNVRQGDPIRLTLKPGTGPPAVTGVFCTTNPVATNATGVAAFAGCEIPLETPGYRLIASTPNATSVETNSFNVYGNAYRLAFTAQPQAGVGSQIFAIQPIVAVHDQFGDTVLTGPTSAPTVTLSLGPGAPAGATLTCSGGNASVAAAGIATFSGCSINAAGTFTLVASATGLLPGTSLAIPVTTPGSIALSTSAPIPPGAKDSVILWGQGLTLSAAFAMPGGAGRPFTLEATRDGITWMKIAALTSDATGRASFQYRPVTNLFYRAAFAGAQDLSGALSNQVRTVVRELAVLRPTNSGVTKTLERNTSIAFTTTVRPARPELAPATVSFLFYRNVSGVWQLVTKRNIPIDGAGLARTTFTFSTPGQWRVRSQAGPTPYNANSVMTPIEQYVVG